MSNSRTKITYCSCLLTFLGLTSLDLNIHTKALSLTARNDKAVLHQTVLARNQTNS